MLETLPEDHAASRGSLATPALASSLQELSVSIKRSAAEQGALSPKTNKALRKADILGWETRSVSKNYLIPVALHTRGQDRQRAATTQELLAGSQQLHPTYGPGQNTPQDLAALRATRMLGQLGRTAIYSGSAYIDNVFETLIDHDAMPANGIPGAAQPRRTTGRVPKRGAKAAAIRRAKRSISQVTPFRAEVPFADALRVAAQHDDRDYVPPLLTAYILSKPRLSGATLDAYCSVLSQQAPATQLQAVAILVREGYYFAAVKIVYGDAELLRATLDEMKLIVSQHMDETQWQAALEAWNWKESDKELFVSQFRSLQLVVYYQDVRRQLQAMRTQGLAALVRVEREMLVKVIEDFYAQMLEDQAAAAAAAAAAQASMRKEASTASLRQEASNASMRQKRAAEQEARAEAERQRRAAAAAKILEERQKREAAAAEAREKAKADLEAKRGERAAAAATAAAARKAQADSAAAAAAAKREARASVLSEEPSAVSIASKRGAAAAAAAQKAATAAATAPAAVAAEPSAASVGSKASKRSQASTAQKQPQSPTPTAAAAAAAPAALAAEASNASKATTASAKSAGSKASAAGAAVQPPAAPAIEPSAAAEPAKEASTAQSLQGSESQPADAEAAAAAAAATPKRTSAASQRSAQSVAAAAAAAAEPAAAPAADTAVEPSFAPAASGGLSSHDGEAVAVEASLAVPTSQDTQDPATQLTDEPSQAQDRTSAASSATRTPAQPGEQPATGGVCEDPAPQEGLPPAMQPCPAEDRTSAASQAARASGGAVDAGAAPTEGDAHTEADVYTDSAAAEAETQERVSAGSAVERASGGTTKSATQPGEAAAQAGEDDTAAAVAADAAGEAGEGLAEEAAEGAAQPGTEQADAEADTAAAAGASPQGSKTPSVAGGERTSDVSGVVASRAASRAGVEAGLAELRRAGSEARMSADKAVAQARMGQSNSLTPSRLSTPHSDAKELATSLSAAQAQAKAAEDEEKIAVNAMFQESGLADFEAEKARLAAELAEEQQKVLEAQVAEKAASVAALEAAREQLHSARSSEISKTNTPRRPLTPQEKQAVANMDAEIAKVEERLRLEKEALAALEEQKQKHELEKKALNDQLARTMQLFQEQLANTIKMAAMLQAQRIMTGAPAQDAPTLPQVPLPQEVDEPPTEDEIRDYGRYLGMDVESDSDLLYIAEWALTAPVPEGWTVHLDNEGHEFFYNAATKKSSYEHPMDQHYKEYYAKKKAEKTQKTLPASQRPKALRV